MKEPLVDRECLLEKFPGKGGWTYTAIPEVPQDRHAPFGWVKVKGSIDGYEIRKFRLMPMGNGSLFLPVRAHIRKKIRKQAGDFVHVLLWIDHEPTEVPNELLMCLKVDPEAHSFFELLPDTEQEEYVKWIYSARNEQIRVERIATCLELLSKGQRLNLLSRRNG